MFRDEQITEAAKKYVNVFLNVSNTPSNPQADRFHDFKRGARWADCNPAWRSVEKELPEEYRDVLITDGEFVYMAWLEKKAMVFWYSLKYTGEVYIADCVTHWMPLPPLPTEKD